MKKVLIGIVVFLVLIQLIPIDRTNKPVDPKQNFVEVLKTPKEVTEMLKNACYDCHSNEVKYPSYAYIAPISWSIKHHVNEGKKNVNFSDWMTYNKDQKDHILDEIIETIERTRSISANSSSLKTYSCISGNLRFMCCKIVSENSSTVIFRGK